MGANMTAADALRPQIVVSDLSAEAVNNLAEEGARADRLPWKTSCTKAFAAASRVGDGALRRSDRDRPCKN